MLPASCSSAVALASWRRRLLAEGAVPRLLELAEAEVVDDRRDERAVRVRRDEDAVRVRLALVQGEQLLDVGAGEGVLREDDDRVGHAPSLATRQRPSSTPSAWSRCSGVSARAGANHVGRCVMRPAGPPTSCGLHVRHSSSTRSASTQLGQQRSDRPRPGRARARGRPGPRRRRGGRRRRARRRPRRRRGRRRAASRRRVRATGAEPVVSTSGGRSVSSRAVGELAAGGDDRELERVGPARAPRAPPAARRGPRAAV